jgi:HlyD family secretion protein
MDRAVPKYKKVKQKRKLFSQLGFGLLAFISLLMVFNYALSPSVDRAEILTAKVLKGDLEACFTASGTVVPKYEELLISPIKSKILQALHHTGEEVLKGQQILKLDQAEVKAEVQKLKNELLVKQNKIKQLKLSLERNLLNLKTSLEIKKMELKEANARIESEKKLIEIGGGSRENLNKIILSKQIKELEIHKTKKEIENSESKMEIDLKDQEIQIDIQKQNIQNMEDKLALSFMRAPNNGVITKLEKTIGKQINPGEMLGSIANLNSYRVNAKTSQTNSKKLKINSKAKIILEDTSFYGRVSNIQANIENNTVNFDIEISDKYCDLLRPNQKLEIGIVTAYSRNCLKVKNGNFYKGAKQMEVFKIVDDVAHQVIIESGETNFDFVEIKSGLNEGDEIIITDMSDFENKSEILIND